MSLSPPSTKPTSDLTLLSLITFPMSPPVSLQLGIRGDGRIGKQWCGICLENMDTSMHAIKESSCGKKNRVGEREDDAEGHE